ncbi:uncharacterized protein EV420DRAFT_1638683 [Desarmillaria tabescens]|uniref:Uncharacterized protein n=1 Tax=Armillaria tabescens TaxID=1929756 RepID=A0AA39NDQ4_ARMTA|nr:uncharacterized protein EV420DRAFT_1638683 [Desarmillaria tabescens]KAK0463762.1 hypothetical protein EV420DRAFT_1638683 [Desarmillaria tabescens]
MNLQVVPPACMYFAFSIDVAATLGIYCDGGDDLMLQKLEGLKDRMYAGYCVAVEDRVDENNKFHVTNIRPVQQGLTKPYSRKPRYAQPAMCIPIFPETTHPRSREPLELSKPLPWNNCYHPTCYDFYAHLIKPLAEDGRYYRLLQSGLDEVQVLRILDGQEDAPDTVDLSGRPDDEPYQTFLANIPGSEEPEDDIFMPVLCIKHVLSNVTEISDPSQLREDRDLFQAIVEEYQLERYGPVVYETPEYLSIEDETLPDNFSIVYSLMSSASGNSTEELDSGFPDSHELTLSEEEAPQVPVPGQKGIWRVKSFFRRAMMNVLEVLKRRKLSNNS